MDREPRTRLEQLMFERRFSLADFQREFRTQASLLGEDTEVSQPQLKRWLRGGAGLPRAASCRVLETWFDDSVESLLGPPFRSVTKHVNEQELAVHAGRESVRHAIAASSALDPSALEHLQAAAGYAARAYLVSPPLEMLTDLVALRDTVYAQLDRTHKPLQQAELYLIAGEVCGLLSSVSWDLGLADAAEEQARAAHTYGSVIDHQSLQAWARALQVMVAFWSGRPRKAASVAAAAIAKSPGGTAKARLHSVNARALALIGARGEVEAELNAANDELDRAGDDAFLDEIGGELAFDRARRALCGGAAYVTLGTPDDADLAEREANTAIELFAQRPEEERWGAGALGAHVDLAAARTMRGDLAGTKDALVRVLSIEPARRTEAIAQRLHNLSRSLGAVRFRGATEARELGEAIEDFTTTTLSRVTMLAGAHPPRALGQAPQ